MRGAKVRSSAYLEYELVLRSSGHSSLDIYNDLSSFRHIKNLGEAPLSVGILIKAIELGNRHEITYFDSLHAATALEHDKAIISTDRIYDEIEGVELRDPREYTKQVHLNTISTIVSYEYISP